MVTFCDFRTGMIHVGLAMTLLMAVPPDPRVVIARVRRVSARIFVDKIPACLLASSTLPHCPPSV